MGDLTVVENVSVGAEVTCSFSPHPNVILLRRNKPQDTTTTERNNAQGQLEEQDSVAACKLNVFQPYLNSIREKSRVVRKKVVRIILLQIAHAVCHIHKQGWYLGVRVAFGLADMDVLRVSEDRNKVVVVLDPLNKCASENLRQEDVRRVADVFNGILQGANARDKLSDHLLESMLQLKYLFNKILQHPYFWETKKKLRFLADVAQLGKEGVRREMRGLVDDLEQRFSEVVDVNGWFTQLDFNEVEVKNIDNYRRQYTSDRNLVSRHAIRDLAENPRIGGYNPEKLHSLVNFIRNHMEHFWEQMYVIQECFYLDPCEEYWEFFNKRFKDLLPVVYEVMMIRQDNGHKITQISDTYFEPLALNQDLPVLPRGEQEMRGN